MPKARVYLLILCGLWFGWLATLPGSPAVVLAESMADIEVFSRQGCPHCAAAKLFLAELQQERPTLRIVIHDVSEDPAALARLQALATQHEVQALGVPAFYLREELLIGYRNADTTGAQLKALLDRPPPRLSSAPDAPGVAVSSPATARPLGQDSESVDIPLLGRVNARELGLPLFTIVLGLLDGFNPCAMWVLLFVLSLLVNLRNRARMALIGGTFVLVSGLAYFAFMAAWLNIFFLIGLSRATQVGLGGIALLVGAINVKDFFTPGQGVSLSIPAAARPGIYARVRRILQAENLTGALASVVILAVLVNIVELLCTAGFPAIYTRILTLHHLPWWAYYAYIGLYNVAYMLDDSLMLILAVITLGRRKLQEREGRWLKLLSGVVMLALGGALVVRPEWLLGKV